MNQTIITGIQVIDDHFRSNHSGDVIMANDIEDYVKENVKGLPLGSMSDIEGALGVATTSDIIASIKEDIVASDDLRTIESLAHRGNLLLHISKATNHFPYELYWDTDKGHEDYLPVTDESLANKARAYLQRQDESGGE